MSHPEKHLYQKIWIVVIALLMIAIIAQRIDRRNLKKRNSAGHLLELHRPWVNIPSIFEHPKPAGLYGKIAICTFSTENIKEYSLISKAINQRYAERHGYDFHFFELRSSKRSPAWEKVQSVHKLLKTKTNDGRYFYNYVFWIDADAIFNLHELTLESIIQGDYQIYFSDDHYKDVANTGTFLIKNSSWSREFVRFWWEAGESSDYAKVFPWEQRVFSLIFKNNLCGVRQKTLIRPRGTFNSNPMIKEFPEGWDETFVIHLMGMKTHQRVCILKELYERKGF